MTSRLITIQTGNRIHLPKEVCDYLDIKPGTQFILKVHGDKKGLVLCKPSLFDEIELDLQELDSEFDELYESIGLKKKSLKDKVNRLL